MDILSVKGQQAVCGIVDTDILSVAVVPYITVIIVIFIHADTGSKKFICQFFYLLPGKDAAYHCQKKTACKCQFSG